MSGEGPRIIQDRIALFACICAAISGAFLIAEYLLIGLQQPDWAQMEGTRVDAMFLWHTIGTALLAGIWLLTRSRLALSAFALTLIDAATVTLGSVAFTLMAIAPHDLGATTSGLLASTSLVTARAILVPSEARRTLWVSSIAMLPVVASAWISAHFQPLIGFGTHLKGDVDAFAISLLTDRILWSGAAIAIATVASRVIYGLRQEVRAARQLGQYTLEEHIGEGGMGAVYRAQHALLRRPTAIKLLHKNHSGPHQQSRFEREVQLTAMLTHPNTINVYDYGHTPDGIFYYAMEFLDGFNLDELVALDGPQPAGRVIHLVAQAAGALAEAHSVGLIHRDIKPANVFVCERGGLPDVVKVLDFGLVKNIATGDPTLSNVNTLAGTPLYMPPEAIIDPDSVDARSDLYALGAVAYFLLTGTHVFSGSSIVEICGHHLHTPPEPPSTRLGKAVSADLEAVILACLAKEPAQRPQSARDLAERLRACIEAEAWNEDRARRWWSQRPEKPADRVPASQSPSKVLEVVRERGRAKTG